SKPGKIVINSFYCEVFASQPCGIKGRNLSKISLRDGQFEGAVGTVAYDFDGSCANVEFDNTETTQGMTSTMTGLTKVFSTGYESLSPAENERFKYYVSSSLPVVDQYFGLFDHAVWAKKISMIAGATYDIPPNNGSLGFCRVKVICSAAGAVEEWGEFIITSQTTDATSHICYGSANMAGSSTAGKFSVERAAYADKIILHNNMAATLDVSVYVEYARATPIA
ncbi:MAG TPA: hypothetical protein VIY48_14695, partial [Candidatus Paceibacterota bacterium]